MASRPRSTKSVASTICVSLDARSLELLNDLAKTAGSRSAALRHLLGEHERQRKLQELEAAYLAYFADPLAAETEGALTDEMLSIASWPDDEMEAPPTRDAEDHPPR